MGFESDPNVKTWMTMVDQVIELALPQLCRMTIFEIKANAFDIRGQYLSKNGWRCDPFELLAIVNCLRRT